METALVMAVGFPLTALLGVFVGAHLTHRAHLHQNPMPDLAGVVRGLLAVCRKKPKPTKNGVYKPTMRA